MWLNRTTIPVIYQKQPIHLYILPPCCWQHLGPGGLVPCLLYTDLPDEVLNMLPAWLCMGPQGTLAAGFVFCVPTYLPWGLTDGNERLLLQSGKNWKYTTIKVVWDLVCCGHLNLLPFHNSGVAEKMQYFNHFNWKREHGTGRKGESREEEAWTEAIFGEYVYNVNLLKYFC